MFRYGIKDFIRNIYSNIFIAIQLAVTFIIACAAVSSVLSRTEKYTSIKQFFDFDEGFIIELDSLSGIDLFHNIDEYPEIKAMYCPYEVSLRCSKTSKTNPLGDDHNRFLNAITEEYINAFKPDMSEGVWLDQAEVKDGVVPVVVTANDTYELGDTAILMYREAVREMSPDEEGYDEYDPYYYEIRKVEAEVIGIIDEDSELFGFDKTYFAHGYTEDFKDYDFRDLYQTYDKDVSFAMITSVDAVKHLNRNMYPCGSVIISLDGQTPERAEQLRLYIREYGQTTPIAEFKQNSFVYVANELVKLVPLLICIVILVIVSTVSSSALSTKSSLISYGIYYLCGSGWGSCLKIGFISNVITTLLGGLLAVIIYRLLSLAGFFAQTVVNFSVLHFLSCLAIALINLAFSLLLPAIILKRNTPKEILAGNE